MKILITGGYGYIGSHLAKYLYDNQYEVYLYPKNKDILDTKFMERYISINKFTHVIHCAALVSTRLCNVANQYAYEVNVRGTENIVDICNMYNVKLIYIGTTASYKPIQETITEDTPSEPNTLYGLTKYLGEKYVRNYANRSMTLRFCFCYGANDTVSGISQLIRGYYEGRPVILEMNPDKFKDYMHVNDFCNAVKCVIDRDIFNNSVLNISYQEPRKLKDIVKLLNRRNIQPIIYYRPEADYMGDHVVSSELFREIYNWKPEKTLEQGINECLEC